MARISKTDIYNYDLQPSLLDYLIGTDFDDYLKTKSFRINTILELLNNVNGVNNIQYYFSNGTNPELDYETRGVFFTNNNSPDPTVFASLLFNKEMLSGTDIALLFNLAGGLDNMVIILKNPSDPNNIFNFNITEFQDLGGYVRFGVTPYAGFVLGELLDENIYGVCFDVKATGAAATPAPYNKMFIYTTGDPQTFTLPAGIIAKTVSYNRAPLYGDQAAAIELREWSQTGAVVSINTDINILDDQAQIYITN